jgi:hypothetical protein
MKTGNSRVNYRRLFLQVIRCLKLVVKAIRLEPWGLIIAAWGRGWAAPLSTNHMQGKMF